jgi:hypothetical protein
VAWTLQRLSRAIANAGGFHSQEFAYSQGNATSHGRGFGKPDVAHEGVQKGGHSHAWTCRSEDSVLCRDVFGGGPRRTRSVIQARHSENVVWFPLTHQTPSTPRHPGGRPRPSAWRFGARRRRGGDAHTAMTAPPRRGSPAPATRPESGSRRTAWQPPKKILGLLKRAITISSRFVGSAPGSM